MTYMEEIEPLRVQIDKINREIVALLAKRVKVALEIAEVKSRYGKPIVDRSREEKVLDNVARLAEKKGLEPSGARKVFRTIIDMCVKAEEEHE
ncbi:MAG: chorismate mutase [Candidatus Bathyarchaeota archaeon]